MERKKKRHGEKRLLVFPILEQEKVGVQQGSQEMESEQSDGGVAVRETECSCMEVSQQGR